MSDSSFNLLNVITNKKFTDDVTLTWILVCLPTITSGLVDIYSGYELLGAMSFVLCLFFSIWLNLKVFNFTYLRRRSARYVVLLCYFLFTIFFISSFFYEQGSGFGKVVLALTICISGFLVLMGGGLAYEDYKE